MWVLSHRILQVLHSSQDICPLLAGTKSFCPDKGLLPKTYVHMLDGRGNSSEMRQLLVHGILAKRLGFPQI